MYSQSSSKNEDPLKKRYFYKLSTNLIGLIISMFTQAIIPRGLGPKAYGDFNFLSNFFNQIVSFLDMGTSTAFYTKLSQRQKEAGIVQFYFCFVLLVSILVMFVVLIANTSSFLNVLLWPGQENRFIYMAAVLGILTWIVQILNKMVDGRDIKRVANEIYA